MIACVGATDISIVLLANCIEIFTRPITGRQHSVRFPLYASYDLVYFSNAC